MTNEVNVSRIEEILNVKAEVFSEEGVVKASFPRTDAKVTIDNWPMKPFMGLASWTAFQKGVKEGIEVMVMGDLVLFEDEVNSVMSVALETLQVTALHNHFFFDNPKVYFMHISGEGELDAFASGIRNALDTVNAIRTTNPQPQTSFKGEQIPIDNDIDGTTIETILGVGGAAKDGMFKIVIGRKTSASCGCLVGKNMGVNTWAAFAGNNDNAVVDGDFAVLEDELQPVLKALRAANINIVAIHNHMTFEQPRIIFLHFWGKGKATDLAKALKSALDKTHEPDLLTMKSL